MVQAFSQRPEPQSFQPLRPCAAPSDPLRRLRDGGGLDCVRRPDGKRCVALELGRQRQRSAGWGEVAKGPMRGMPTQCRCMERETSSSCRPLPGRMGLGPFAGLGSARILEIDAFPGRSRPQNGQTGKGASFRAGSATRHASLLTPATGRQQRTRFAGCVRSSSARPIWMAARCRTPRTADESRGWKAACQRSSRAERLKCPSPRSRRCASR